MNLIRFVSLASVLSVIGLSSADATHPILFGRFAFDPNQSNLDISGGFAGVNDDYSIHGSLNYKRVTRACRLRFRMSRQCLIAPASSTVPIVMLWSI